jgi:hypothetical protein
MGTTTATAIIDRAASLLQDTTFTRWSQARHLDWLNEGQREAVLLDPTLYVINDTITLTKGTKQSLPDDARVLLDVPRNADGYAITPVARKSLDSQVPDWHSPTRANARVQHFCPAPGDPTTFYVYPPSPGGNNVEVVYHATPPSIGLNAAIAIDDSYAGALVDYLMYRAYAKDSEYGGAADLAALHRQSFVSIVKGTGAQPAAQAPAA